MGRDEARRGILFQKVALCSFHHYKERGLRADETGPRHLFTSYASSSHQPCCVVGITPFSAPPLVFTLWRRVALMATSVKPKVSSAAQCRCLFIRIGQPRAPVSCGFCEPVGHVVQCWRHARDYAGRRKSCRDATVLFLVGCCNCIDTAQSFSLSKHPERSKRGHRKGSREHLDIRRHATS